MKAIVFDKDGTLTPYSLWGEIVHSILASNLPLGNRDAESKERIVEEYAKVVGVTRDGTIYRDGFGFSRKKRPSAAFRLAFLTLRHGLHPLKAMKAVLTLTDRWMYGYGEALEKSDLSTTIGTLEYLAGKGYHLALFSNDTEGSIEVLQKALGKPYFSYVVHKDSKPRKPSPEIFTVYAKALGIGKEEIAFVTDTIEDLETGHKAGIGKLIALAGTMEKGDLAPHCSVVIDSLVDLKTIF